jgi:acyl carrier protein
MKFPVNKVSDDKPLTELVADSFIFVELLLTLQEEFAVELSQEDLENVHVVSDLLHLLRRKLPTGGLVSEAAVS